MVPSVRNSDGQERPPGILRSYWQWLILVTILLFVAAIRIRLLQIPLERDEGEFAYMGQLMLEGIPPYLLAYNMKLPGIYAAYALIMACFGQTVAGIHLGLMIINGIAIVLLFLVTRHLFDDLAGIVAAGGYALLSLSPSVNGTSAHATQFIVPFALGGTLLLLKSIDSGKSWMLFASGLLYGLAFLMKQHAVFFIPFAVLYFIWSIARKPPLDLRTLGRGAVLLIVGSVIPFLVSCVLLYAAGVFSKFWFWTFTYGYQYVSEMPLSFGFEVLMILAPKVIRPWTLVWLIAGMGLTAVIWNGKARENWFFLIGTTFFSFLTVCPGFFFRRHYFVTLLPAVALLAGVSVSAATQYFSRKKVPRLIQMIPALLMVLTMIIPILKQSNFLFRATATKACRIMYGTNPFAESIEIAEYIKDHSTENDSIVVLGSEPQIYFYSNRKSATGFIYVYGLMEPHDYASRMQLDMIQEIEKVRPKYAVVVDVPDSWLRRRNSDPTIFRWMERYFGLNYRAVGFVDITPDGNHRAYWDEEAIRNKPSSRFNIFLLERTKE
jgi:hypothetical protein